MTHLARGGSLPPQRVLQDHAMRGNPQLSEGEMTCRRVVFFKDGPLEQPRCLVNCTRLSRGTKLYHSLFLSGDMHTFATAWP